MSKASRLVAFGTLAFATQIACAASGGAQAPPATAGVKPAATTKVAFTTGHGEQAPTDGFRLAWMLLAGSYDLTLVNPSLQAIDAGADVVVVAGPTDPFDARGRAEIDRFLRSGKGGVFLVDATVMRGPRWLDGGGLAPAPTATIANDTGLDPLLGSYGLRVAAGLILDPPSAPGPYPGPGRTLREALPAFVRVVVRVSVGGVVQPGDPALVAEPTTVIFPYASAVEEVASAPAGGRRTWSLAESSPASWRQPEYVYRGFYQRAGRPGGPFSVARALELSAPIGRRTRVVVIGDSDFACDEILRLVTVVPGYDGGSRFLRGAIAWAAATAP